MKNPTLTLTHSEATRERLLSFIHQNQTAYIGIKVAALLLTLEGQRPGWICEILGMSRQTLNVLMHRVNERGLMAFEPPKKPGRPARLTPRIRQTLQEHLEKSPSEFGLNRVQWDGPTLVVHLKRQFGITLKVRQAQAWMHQLGYRLKRASYSYLQARKEDAKRFRRTLKKTADPGSQGNDRIRG
jgi:transposase